MRSDPMFKKILLFRNLIDNIPKNFGIYSVGVMFLILNRFNLEVISNILALGAFLISYSSIYILNDLHDVDEDAMDNEKTLRKPLTQGRVERSEAINMLILFQILGFTLSLLLNLRFLFTMIALLLVNALYSVPLLPRRIVEPNSDDSELTPERAQRISLKYTAVGLPLVLIMQMLKILLPWTINADLTRFPVVFALGFSILYIVIFKGYKAGMTIGESIRHERGLATTAILVFIISMFVHPEQILQAMMIVYLMVGILIFWRFRLTDRTVIILSPIYIGLGVFGLFYFVSIVNFP